MFELLAQLDSVHKFAGLSPKCHIEYDIDLLCLNVKHHLKFIILSLIILLWYLYADR